MRSARLETDGFAKDFGALGIQLLFGWAFRTSKVATNNCPYTICFGHRGHYSGYFTGPGCSECWDPKFSASRASQELDSQDKRMQVLYISQPSHPATSPNARAAEWISQVGSAKHRQPGAAESQMLRCGGSSAERSKAAPPLLRQGLSPDKEKGDGRSQKGLLMRLPRM